MTSKDDPVGRALEAIQNSNLRHPDNRLLECFLEDSVDPEATAQYVLSTCPAEQGRIDFSSLLSASQLDDPRNYWLVSRSAAIALSQGYFDFIIFPRDPVYNVCQVRPGGPERPSILDKVPLVTKGRFKDYSESGIPLPDVSLIQASSQFSKPIAWYRASTEIALKQHKSTSVSTKFAASFCNRLSEYGAVLFSAFCRLMLSPLRAQIYHGLWFLGVRLYGPSCSFNVQRLPFGMYLKTKRQEEHESLASEYGTLQFLRKLTQIPVPRPLDLFSSSDTSYLLITQLPGYPVGLCLDSMSEEGVDAFNNELQQYLAELRSMPKPVGINHAICNAIGGPLYDYRMIAGQNYDKDRGDFIDPFATEHDFNNKLQTPALPGVCHKSGHQIVLTHADINMRNILYHNGKISGIIDWENAGWFPDYWEYTKALYVTKVNRRWLSMMDRVFATFGDFKDDYIIECKLWYYCM